MVAAVDNLNKSKTYYNIKGYNKILCGENVIKSNLSLQSC